MIEFHDSYSNLLFPDRVDRPKNDSGDNAKRIRRAVRLAGINWEKPSRLPSSSDWILGRHRWDPNISDALSRGRPTSGGPFSTTEGCILLVVACPMPERVALAERSCRPAPDSGPGRRAFADNLTRGCSGKKPRVRLLARPALDVTNNLF